MIRISIVLLSLITFFSCGNKNKIPNGILKPDEMQAVLWDVIKAEAFTAGFIKKDSTKNATAENLKLQQQVFTIHHISRQEFYKSYGYYKLNPGRLKIIMDSMTVQAERNKYKNLKANPVQAK